MASDTEPFTELRSSSGRRRSKRSSSPSHQGGSGLPCGIRPKTFIWILCGPLVIILTILVHLSLRAADSDADSKVAATFWAEIPAVEGTGVAGTAAPAAQGTASPAAQGTEAQAAEGGAVNTTSAAEQGSGEAAQNTTTATATATAAAETSTASAEAKSSDGAAAGGTAGSEPKEGGSEKASSEKASSDKPSSEGASSAPAAPAPEPRRILAVTTTYPRDTQWAYLTRLAAVLRQVPPPGVTWIVVEEPKKTWDTESALAQTADLCLPLGRPNCSKIDYVHLATGEPKSEEEGKQGVSSRNAALAHIAAKKLEGVVYFMDDDNIYMAQMFEEISRVRSVGIWPVGRLVEKEQARLMSNEEKAKPQVERPLVRPREGGAGGVEVYGWQTSEPFLSKRETRMFNVDLAGFAFSSKLLWQDADSKGFPKQPVRLMKASKQGMLADKLLRNLVPSPKELEAMADQCTDVWAWRWHSESSKELKYPRYWFAKQPKVDDLVAIKVPDTSLWPFVVNGTRYGMKGKGEKGERDTFVYVA